MAAMTESLSERALPSAQVHVLRWLPPPQRWADLLQRLPGSWLQAPAAAIATWMLAGPLAFDFQGHHAAGGQARQQGEGVQAGRLFQGMEYRIGDRVAALAHGGIARGLVCGEAVDQHVVQAHAAAAVGVFFPVHELRRRTHAVAARRR